MVHTLRIISYVVGHRGASSDARAWACSSVVDAPARYLRKDEWIWADLGYPFASYLVSPYQHLAATKSIDFRRFNYSLSSIRIRSEHAMAYVKGRFPALKGYRGLLASLRAEEYAHDFIVAALVAHNLAMQHDEAGRYLVYVKEGLDRSMTPRDYDWDRANDDDLEREMEWQKERDHQQWRHQQEEAANQFSSTDRDIIRIDSAKERRESLHDALNRAYDLQFVDTTWRSRQKELTKKQLADVERRRIQAVLSRGHH
ncbi:unnamed protein product [Tilletia controversa]|uniref:DDE Tnp4 domain-containing protein n=2 Tax=Tilletia TaxID=13289 RepID=A0A8X7SSD9_9BASI|nr:hypothetical protein CF328_g8186 [Tilletia controversa]KAE8238319.1 hypothetical protein A4X06_0g8868 [Tilletia controversa]CAD6971171.1 unnamed protein product [Tilletia controversa]CAD6982509.1 unnamed protein product [Tilletia controversa]CAD7065051.1 unnamed protein product [Tilletia caries]